MQTWSHRRHLTHRLHRRAILCSRHQGTITIHLAAFPISVNADDATIAGEQAVEADDIMEEDVVVVAIEDINHLCSGTSKDLTRITNRHTHQATDNKCIIHSHHNNNKIGVETVSRLNAVTLRIIAGVMGRAPIQEPIAWNLMRDTYLMQHFKTDAMGVTIFAADNFDRLVY